MEHGPNPNVGTPEKVRETRRGIPGLIWAIGLVILCYVLSTGPVLRLTTAKMFPARLVNGFYSPLVVSSRACPPLEKFLNWYVKDVWAAHAAVKYQRMDD